MNQKADKTETPNHAENSRAASVTEGTTLPRAYTPPAIIYCAPLEALAGDCTPAPPGKDPVSCTTGLS